MEKLFISAAINERTIYIKVDSSIIEELFDILYDRDYLILKVSPGEWDLQIHYGNAYEIDTLKEVEEFEELNLKRHYEQQS